MKAFLEFLPIVIFFIVYKWNDGDIMLATQALMVAYTLQVLVTWLIKRSIEKKLLITYLLVMVFGAATLAFHNEMFIKWKPTIVNWAFSLVLILSLVIAKKNLIKNMLDEQIVLPDFAWRNLNYGWSLAFFISGVLNLIIAYQFDDDFWVSYKLFGGMGLTLFYVLSTGVYLAKVKKTHPEQVSFGDDTVQENSEKNQ